MAKRADITPELCRQLLRYDPETGKLFWKARPTSLFTDERTGRAWNTRFADKEAFTAISRGYHIGAIHYVMVKAHRVAWAIHYGEWPDVIDHINGNPSDNRITNLRNVSQTENMRNLSQRTDNTSGASGVWREGNKWAAEIKFKGKKRWLGRYESFEDACAARANAQAELGFAKGHGRPSGGIL